MKHHYEILWAAQPLDNEFGTGGAVTTVTTNDWLLVEQLDR